VTRVDAPAETDDPGRRWQVLLRAVAALVDAQDQVGKARGAQERELACHVFGGPEADDLE